MDTNRLGNLKRFFSISDSDRVWDVKAAEDSQDMKNAGGLYDYIFYNPLDVKLSSQMAVILKELLSYLAPAGKLVLYFDNPYSIHNFAQGAFVPGVQGSCYSYPLIRQEIDNFSEKEGIFVKWYYPYPNVSFPAMFFSEERLPESGECDDNFYHFDKTRVEIFDEKAAVDTLATGGMYPYLAHAYMVVLSREELREMPLYTRFSNERRKDRQIRTDLLDGAVKKTAVCREAADHIQQMSGFETKLQEVFGGLRILGRPCEINKLTARDEGEMSVSFAYAEGESLESMLDGMLAEGREEEVADILLDICRQLRNLKGQEPFEVTDDFEEVFGKFTMTDGDGEECSGGKDFSSLPLLDIDMVCQNILISQEKAVVIDYEWTFSFPIPLDYLIFRFLYFYLEGKMRECMQRQVFADIYNKAGITEAKKVCFLTMETHFQRYVQQGAAVLRNEFDIRGGGLISKEEFSLWQKEKDGTAALVIYQDGSRRNIREKRGKDGISGFLVPVGGNSLLTFSCFAGSPVVRIGAMTERAGVQEGISFITDAVPLAGLLYRVIDNRIEIRFENLSPEDYQLFISVEEVKMSGAAMEELVKTIEDLRFLVDNRQQQLEGLKNSASWKLTKPLRMLKGNKEE